MDFPVLIDSGPSCLSLLGFFQIELITVRHSFSFKECAGLVLARNFPYVPVWIFTAFTNPKGALQK